MHLYITSAYNFNLYVNSNSIERAHFQVPLGVLYIQVYMYLIRLQYVLIDLFVMFNLQKIQNIEPSIYLYSTTNALFKSKEA